MKICYLDVETTGLSAIKNDIIQVAFIVEIDGEVVDTGEFKCQPYNYNDISPKALEVHGYGIPELLTFERPEKVKALVESILSRYVNKYDKNDKFIMAGYNVNFDYKFMREFWKKSGDKYFGSYFEYRVLDIYPLFQMYVAASGADVPNHKLVTAANHFGITFNAHDAMDDIYATRQVYKELIHIFELGLKELKNERNRD